MNGNMPLMSAFEMTFEHRWPNSVHASLSLRTRRTKRHTLKLVEYQSCFMTASSTTVQFLERNSYAAGNQEEYQAIYREAPQAHQHFITESGHIESAIPIRKTPTGHLPAGGRSGSGELGKA